MSESAISSVQSTLACVVGIVATGLCMGNALRLITYYGFPCRLLSSTSQQRVLQGIFSGFWLSLPLLFLGIGLSDIDQSLWINVCGFGWLVYFLPLTVAKQVRLLNRRYTVYQTANQLILDGKFATLLETSPEWQRNYQYYGLARMPVEGCPETNYSTQPKPQGKGRRAST